MLNYKVYISYDGIITATFFESYDSQVVTTIEFSKKDFKAFKKEIKQAEKDFIIREKRFKLDK